VKLNQFYRDELNFLHQQGREFALAHPQLTRFLGEPGMDPDVERLLEGFAFLSGRMRQKIEDEFPELTHSLFNLLWPNYLRPMPSATIMRFDPRLHAISETQQVARHTEVRSRPIGEGSAATGCRFRTCRPLAVHPLTVAEVGAEHSREVSTVHLDLAIHSDQPLSELGLSDLRLFLGTAQDTAQSLYLWLNHYLDHVELTVDGQTRRLPASLVQPVGFADEDALLPYPRNVGSGYRILQEYLNYPEAFHFVDVAGLGRFLPAQCADEIRLSFRFGRILPPGMRVGLEQFQLHCVPAINLFSQGAEPVDFHGRQTEYRISPSARSPEHFEVFSVDKVEGWLEGDQSANGGREYHAFESFEHEVERERGHTALYYRIRARDSQRLPGFDHFIALVRADESFCTDRHESVSLSLTCSNRNLPVKLTAGEICEATEQSPTFATFHNLTRPSTPVRPALEGSLMWKLVSNLSLNYTTLLDVDSLRTVLQVYDFRALADQQAERISRQRLNAISDVRTRPIDRLWRGLPVRGITSELTLNEDGFATEGDLYLFATVLSRFFGLYASINAFHELTVLNSSNQERYTWTLQSGQQPLM